MAERWISAHDLLKEDPEPSVERLPPLTTRIDREQLQEVADQRWEAWYAAARAGDDEALAAFDDLLMTLVTGKVWHRARRTPNLGHTTRRNGKKPITTQAATPLTRRLRRIVECWADGLTDEQTAELLCLSSLTVKTYGRVVMKKLGMRTRTGAVAALLRAGVIR